MSKASDELDRAIRKTQEESKLLLKTGRELSKKAQIISDLGDASIELNRIAPDSPDIEHQISAWINLGNSVQTTQQDIKGRYLPVINSAAGTVTASTSASYSGPVFFYSLGEDKRPAAQEALATVQRILHREADEEPLLRLMRDYGLDIPEHGKRVQSS